MATMNEIASQASYTGNAALGGGTLGVVQLDTRPVEQLAYYTMQHEKLMAQQRRQDTDAKIQELAELTAIDPNSAIAKDKDLMLSTYNEAIKVGKDYAKLVPKNNQERIQQFLDYKSKMQDLKKMVTSGSARSIAYVNRKNTILKDPKLSAEQKDFKIKKLEEEANATDIWTPITAEEEFDMSIPSVGEATTRKVDVLIATGNDNITETVDGFDPTTNWADALMTGQGLKERIVDPNSPEWANLSDRQKEEQQALQMANKSGISVWMKAEDIIKQALSDPKYNQNGQLNIEALKRDNPMLNGLFGLADEWNKYSKAKRDDAAAGRYTDNMGRSGQLINGIKAEDYFDINYSDGLNAAEIVFLAKFAKHKGDNLIKKVDHHGDATKVAMNDADNAAALKRQRESDAAANYRARLAKETPAVVNGEPQGFGNIIDNVNADEVQMVTPQGNRRWTINGKPARMVNGVIVDATGQPVTTGKMELVVPAKAVGDVVLTEYNKNARTLKATTSTGGDASDGDGEAKYASRIVPDSNGNITIQVDKGVVQGIMTQNKTFADRDQFGGLTQKLNLVGVTKVKPASTEGIVSDNQRSSGSNRKVVPANSKQAEKAGKWDKYRKQ